MTWFALWVLHRLWRRRTTPRARMPSRPTRWLLVAAGLGALAALWIEPRGAGLSPLAFWGAGASHLVITLVIWRVWHAIGPGSFAYAQLPPAVLTTLLAVGGLQGQGCSQDLRDPRRPGGRLRVGVASSRLPIRGGVTR